MHYSYGKGEKDELNIRNQGTWRDGELKYLEGAKNNFGLVAEDIKGELQSIETKNWLKTKGVYVD
jgi:hypothetical protein